MVRIASRSPDSGRARANVSTAENKSLVLFTPVDVSVEKDIPTFRAIAEISDLEMAIADLSEMVLEMQHVVVHQIVERHRLVGWEVPKADLMEVVPRN